jgi:cobalamin biosynthesis protein CobW
VVTLVDAVNADRALAEHEELFRDQLLTADVVLLNKADLVPDPAVRARMLDTLRPLASRAQWLWTDHAAVDPRLLLGVGLLGSAATGAPPATGPGHGLVSVTLPAPDPLDADALEAFLEEISGSVFRVKGVVDVAGGGPMLVQAVGDHVDMEPLDARSPLRSSERRLIFIGTAPDRARLEEGLKRAKAD